MGKNILEKVKISIIAVITGLSCMIVPDTFDVQAAVEGGTDIWLKLEKKTIDIDDVPDNGIVDLEISIENNPELVCMSFIVEKDFRLEYNGFDVFYGANDCVGGSSSGLLDSQNVEYLEVFFTNDSYKEDGVFGYVRVKLPEKSNIRAGDSYKVDLLQVYNGTQPRIGIVLPESKGSKLLKGAEYFGGFEGGEIVITNVPELVQNNPEPSNNSEEQSPTEQRQNNEQPEPQNENSNNNNNNTAHTLTESVTTPVTTVSQTTVITAVVTTVKTTKETTVFTVPVTTIEETESTTETKGTDAVTTKSQEENNNSKIKTIIIICISAIAVVLASVLAVAIKNKKRSKKDE